MSIKERYISSPAYSGYADAATIAAQITSMGMLLRDKVFFKKINIDNLLVNICISLLSRRVLHE